MDRAELSAEDRNGVRSLLWWCPGCKMPHSVPVNGPRGWTWDGNLERPTLSPSVLIRMPSGAPPKQRICHSFVRDGRMDFLSDCTHKLAGQTVELEEWR
jgi:hypothetical protein